MRLLHMTCVMTFCMTFNNIQQLLLGSLRTCWNFKFINLNTFETQATDCETSLRWRLVWVVGRVCGLEDLPESFIKKYPEWQSFWIHFVATYTIVRQGNAKKLGSCCIVLAFFFEHEQLWPWFWSRLFMALILSVSDAKSCNSWRDGWWWMICFSMSIRSILTIMV